MFFIVLTLVVGLAFLLAFSEAALRASTEYLSQRREKINFIVPQDAKKLRILAIGESTTDAIFAEESGVLAWPQQLEDRLLKDGVFARVYNGGVSGSSTYLLLQNLEKNIRKFKPHIVISMMGVNDGARFGSYVKEGWGSFKTVQFYRNFRMWRSLDNSCEKKYSFEKILVQHKKLIEEVPLKILNGTTSPEEAVQQVKNLSGSSPIQDLLIFLNMSDVLYRYMEGVPSIGLAKKIQVLIDAIPELPCFAPSYNATMLVTMYRSSRHEACLKYASSIADTQIFEIDVNARGILENCFAHLTPEQQQSWLPFFKSVVGSAFFEVQGDPTENNYQSLLNILETHKIAWVGMSYPTENAEYLRRIESRSHAIPKAVVDNQKLFEDEIKRKGFDFVFIDRFNTTFGHATTAGNGLIAQNAAQAVLKIYDQIKNDLEISAPKIIKSVGEP